MLGGELALESSLTCMSCLQLLRSPVVGAPCGHSVCGECSAAGCAECGPGAAVRWVAPNAPLDAVCAKYAQRLAALHALERFLSA